MFSTSQDGVSILYLKLRAESDEAEARSEVRTRYRTKIHHHQQINGGLSGVVAEFPALSHFTRGSWVQSPAESRFFCYPHYPLPRRMPYGPQKVPSTNTPPPGQQEGHTQEKNQITHISNDGFQEVARSFCCHRHPFSISSDCI